MSKSSFVCTQLNGFKYYYPTLIILLNDNLLFAHILNCFSTIDFQLLSSQTFMIKKGLNTCHKSNLKNTVWTIISVLGLVITSCLIKSGLSDYVVSLVKVKVECCKSLDHFDYQIKDYSATRIPSSSFSLTLTANTWPHWERLLLCKDAVSIFYSPRQSDSRIKKCD